MDLHGGFRDAQIAGNLLVKSPLRNPNQDGALTRGQRFKSPPEVAQDLIILAAHTVAREPNTYRVQKILLSERLGQKLDGACLHRLHAHRNVPMSGHEDDWARDARCGEIALKIK